MVEHKKKWLTHVAFFKIGLIKGAPAPYMRTYIYTDWTFKTLGGAVLTMTIITQTM